MIFVDVGGWILKLSVECLTLCIACAQSFHRFVISHKSLKKHEKTIGYFEAFRILCHSASSVDPRELTHP